MEENKIYIRPKSKYGQFAIFSTQLNIQKTDKDVVIYIYIYIYKSFDGLKKLKQLMDMIRDLN